MPHTSANTIEIEGRRNTVIMVFVDGLIPEVF